jgi:hypothetical protein
MEPVVRVTSESTLVACDIGTRWEVRCAHGVTPYLDVPGSFPQSPDQIQRRLMAEHQKQFGCDCIRESTDSHPR